MKEPCGAACLGNPLNAMAWLTGELAEQAEILFLASDEASYITGVTLPAAGGDLG